MKKKIFIGLAVLILLAVLLPVMVHQRAKSALENYRRQLVAQGEKLTIEEIAPRLTADDRESANALVSACTMLGSAVSNSPPVMRVLAPGHVLVPWAEEELPTDTTSNLWPGLRAQIQLHAQSLDALREALKQPVGQLSLDYTQGFALLLPHLAPAKASALWLAASVELELHDGHFTNAFQDLTNCVALCRIFEREPLEISQLVRIAINNITLGRTWDALQHPGWQEAQLAALQTAWESLDELNGTESAVEMERNIMTLTFDAVRKNDPNVMGMMGGGTGSTSSGQAVMDAIGETLANPKEGYESFMERYPRYWAWKWHWSYDEELYDLQVMQAGLESYRKLRTNNVFVTFAKEYGAAHTNLLQLHAAATNRFLLGWLADPMEGLFRKVAVMETERRLLVTAIALKRFQLARGKYPADLTELLPAYLAAVPLDGMDGKPLRYQLKPDGSFLLYSVGRDGVDNGGDGTSSSSTHAWTEGKDLVWPVPATAEEIKAYKDKALREWSSKQAKPRVDSRRFATPPAPAGKTN